MIEEEGLRSAFGHVFVLIVFFAVIPVAIGLVLASLVDRNRIRGMGFFRTVFFMP